MHYVYFVQPKGGGPIKIGITNDLDKRLGGLQTGSPVPLVLRHYIEVTDSAQALALERALHQRFGSYRLHGEWFEACRALATMANAVVERRPRRRDRSEVDDPQLSLVPQPRTIYTIQAEQMEESVAYWANRDHDSDPFAGLSPAECLTVPFPPNYLAEIQASVLRDLELAGRL